MRSIWRTAGYALSLLLLVTLVFSSGALSVVLYGKITGREWQFFPRDADFAAFPQGHDAAAEPTPPPAAAVRKSSAMLDAPHIRQHPELHSGCEVTSLAMLIQFAGIPKGKLELAAEMKKDPTPLQQGPDGAIRYWGNPNTGFVGDVTGKSKGFAIYHTALFELLHKYIPSAVDLTKRPFEELEQQVAEGIPVLVWTTVDFSVPSYWVVWDTPIGPIKTTFNEHAVLLVGYDDKNVYLNDPKAAQSKRKVDKKRFVASWKAMGEQALSYRKTK